jgi:hypothetical protein
MRQGRSLNRILAGVALTGYIGYVSLVVLLHLLRRDYDPAFRFLSEYAVGRYGALMTLALVMAGVASLALAVALYAQMRRTLWLAIACGLVLFAGASEFLLALYPTDVFAPREDRKLHMTDVGRIHERVGSAHTVAWLGACLAIPLAVRADGRSRRLMREAMTGSAALLVASALAAAAPRTYAGLGQRVWVAILAAWCVTLALRLRELSL